MKYETGFSLIELILVISLIGILSAAAVPKFANYDNLAKKTILSGIASSINTAAENVNIVCSLNEDCNDSGNSEISIKGTTIKTKHGYPDDSDLGIVKSLKLTGITTEVKRSDGGDDGGNDGPRGSMHFIIDNDCFVSYKAPKNQNTDPKITVIDTGCQSSL